VFRWWVGRIDGRRGLGSRIALAQILSQHAWVSRLSSTSSLIVRTKGGYMFAFFRVSLVPFFHVSPLAWSAEVFA
jgi:hypothetical protein